MGKAKTRTQTHSISYFTTKLIRVAKYVISFNERTRIGRILTNLLQEFKKEVSVQSLEEFQANEDKVLATEIKQSRSSGLLDSSEVKEAISNRKKALKTKH